MSNTIKHFLGAMFFIGLLMKFEAFWLIPMFAWAVLVLVTVFGVAALFYVGWHNSLNKQPPTEEVITHDNHE